MSCSENSNKLGDGKRRKRRRNHFVFPNLLLLLLLNPSLTWCAPPPEEEKQRGMERRRRKRKREKVGTRSLSPRQRDKNVVGSRRRRNGGRERGEQAVWAVWAVWARRSVGGSVAPPSGTTACVRQPPRDARPPPHPIRTRTPEKTPLLLFLLFYPISFSAFSCLLLSFFLFACVTTSTLGFKSCTSSSFSSQGSVLSLSLSLPPPTHLCAIS